MKITKQELIDDALRMKTELGRLPTVKDCFEIGKYGRTTFTRIFGSWTNMINEVFNENRIIDRTVYELKCEQCTCPIKKSKNEIGEHNFCSQSCSTRFFNLRKPKRERTWHCFDCGVSILNGRKFCSDCSKNQKEFLNMNLGEFLKKYNHKGTNRYGMIRQNAKRLLKNNGLLPYCKQCGYSTHVEVCHIKPIQDFSMDTMISEINALTNLVYLCPNHHWELDHKQLKL